MFGACPNFPDSWRRYESEATGTIEQRRTCDCDILFCIEPVFLTLGYRGA